MIQGKLFAGNRLKAIRKFHKLSKEDMTKKLGGTGPNAHLNYNSMETGVRAISMRTVLKIVNEFDRINLNFLFYGIGNEVLSENDEELKKHEIKLNIIQRIEKEIDPTISELSNEVDIIQKRIIELEKKIKDLKTN